MKTKDLVKLKLDDIYWNLKFGRSIRKSNFQDIRRSGLDIPPPVFFLSTGRCGTNWFYYFLSKFDTHKCFHEPIPNLGAQGKLVYSIYQKSGNTPTENEKELMKEIFLAGREQFLRYSYKTNKSFIETNNHISFFAPLLIELFPRAKFIHLVRHPGEFVRSAMRRKFYTGTGDDIKRIVPVSGSYKENWDSMSQAAKCAWLWMETNSYIERFRETIPENQFFFFNFNQLGEESLVQLSKFLDLPINRQLIKSSVQKKKNRQKKGNMGEYQEWSDSMKSDLADIYGNLAEKYEYKI